MSPRPPERHRSRRGRFAGVLVATAVAYARRSNTYLINVVQETLFPVLLFTTMSVTYSVSGREAVDGVDVAGFLLVGMVGLLSWNSAIWSSGFAIEQERMEGTVQALFVSPASRSAVVLGYAVGSVFRLLPPFGAVLVIGLATGARLRVDSGAAVLAAVLALLVASVSTGFLFAGLFVLTRRADLLANILQFPVWVLAGFLVPRDELPGPLHAVSAAVPAGHAVDALRAAALAGAPLAEILPALGAACGGSAVLLLLGVLGLRRVEHLAKRAGQLDLA